MDWTVIAAAAIGGGLLTTIFNYFTSRRSARIDDTTKIQAVYEKTLDDMTERNDKETLQRENKIMALEKERDLLLARLDEARQKQGELLVTVEEMKSKLNKVGDDVNRITGDFGKYPMAGDNQTYGRRTGDKPEQKA